jgi:hypothetical protein
MNGKRHTHHPLLEQYNVDLILKDISTTINALALSNIIADHQLNQ